MPEKNEYRTGISQVCEADTDITERGVFFEEKQSDSEALLVVRAALREKKE